MFSLKQFTFQPFAVHRLAPPSIKSSLHIPTRFFQWICSALRRFKFAINLPLALIVCLARGQTLRMTVLSSVNHGSKTNLWTLVTAF